MVFQAYIKTFPGSCPAKMKGKDCIYLDKQILKPIYVIKLSIRNKWTQLMIKI